MAPTNEYTPSVLNSVRIAHFNSLGYCLNQSHWPWGFCIIYSFPFKSGAIAFGQHSFKNSSKKHVFSHILLPTNVLPEKIFLIPQLAPGQGLAHTIPTSFLPLALQELTVSSVESDEIVGLHLMGCFRDISLHITRILLNHIVEAHRDWVWRRDSHVSHLVLPVRPKLTEWNSEESLALFCFLILHFCQT